MDYLPVTRSFTIPQMRPCLRPLAPVATAVAVAVTAAGCGGQPVSADVPDPGPAGYVEAVEALLAPAGEMASAIRARAEHPDAAPPARARLEAVVDRADRRLAELLELPVDHADLRAQRDRLGSGYADLVAAMGPVVDSIAAGEPTEHLMDASGPFFDRLADLPAATEMSR